MGSKHTRTPPTYFQGDQDPNPQDLRSLGHDTGLRQDRKIKQDSHTEMKTHLTVVPQSQFSVFIDQNESFNNFFQIPFTRQ